MEQRNLGDSSGVGVGSVQGSRDSTSLPLEEGWVAGQTLPGWSAKDTARFWAKVDRSGGPDSCWIWTASRHPTGYGQFMFMRVPRSTHRLALTLRDGSKPSSLFACHHCDNPPCCNPRHLFWGNHADNMRDARNKGRNWIPPASAMDKAHAKLAVDYSNGKMPNHCRFSSNEVEDMRSRWAAGESQVSIAARYGVRQGHIHTIVMRKTYRTLA